MQPRITASLPQQFAYFFPHCPSWRPGLEYVDKFSARYNINRILSNFRFSTGHDDSSKYIANAVPNLQTGLLKNFLFVDPEFRG